MRFFPPNSRHVFLILFALLISIETTTRAEVTNSPNSLKLITSVSVSREFFNPVLGQSVQISLNLTQTGLLTINVLDRDGYVIRNLVSSQPAEKGHRTFYWDGGSNESRIVPNEAYSLYISLHSGKETETYFPANKNLDEIKAELGYYDRKRNVISYRLPKASRVHLQGGVAIVDPSTKKVEGPNMATIVNREPRTSGWIVEPWDGLAESDSRIYIPDLPNFKLAVAASALPENSIITVGNRKQTFLEHAAGRKGKSLLTGNSLHHGHHQGLKSFEDISPTLTLKLQNGNWSKEDDSWLTSESVLKVNGELHGVTAEGFSKLPGHLMFFLNGREFRKIDQPCSRKLNIELPMVPLNPGTNILSVNCTSSFGPAAAFSLRIKKQNSITRNSLKGAHEIEK